MSKTLNRLVFAVGMMAAPLVMVGCAEGEKPAAATPAAGRDARHPAGPTPRSPPTPPPRPARAPAEAPK